MKCIEYNTNKGPVRKKHVTHPRNNNEIETHNYNRYDIVLNNSTGKRNNNMHPPTPEKPLYSWLSPNPLPLNVARVVDGWKVGEFCSQFQA